MYNSTNPKNRNITRFLSSSMALAMVAGMVPHSAQAASFSDTNGHWAIDSIDQWADYGVIEGANGQFRPDDSITRGEIATIINQIMDYQVSARNSFSDLSSSAWYASPILKLNSAGIITGDEAGTVRPEDNITRQEAAIVIANALHIEYATVNSTSFADDASIASWAKGAVSALNKLGLVSGRQGNNFAPTENITRAEVTTILAQGIDLFLNQSGTYEETTTGTVVINTKDVTLENTHIKGDLILAEGIADGDVNLDNVKIDGDIIVKGGGNNSIYLKDVTASGAVNVDKADSSVRLVFSGKTTAYHINVKNDAKIQSNDLSTGSFLGNVNISGGKTIEVDGVFNKVSNSAPSVSLSIDGEIGTVENTASNVSMEISGEVNTLVNQGTSLDLTVDGEIGTVENSGNSLNLEVTENGVIDEMSNTGSNIDVSVEGELGSFETTTDATVNGDEVEGDSSVTDVTGDSDSSDSDSSGSSSSGSSSSDSSSSGNSSSGNSSSGSTDSDSNSGTTTPESNEDEAENLTTEELLEILDDVKEIASNFLTTEYTQYSDIEGKTYMDILTALGSAILEGMNEKIGYIHHDFLDENGETINPLESITAGTTYTIRLGYGVENVEITWTTPSVVGTEGEDDSQEGSQSFLITIRELGDDGRYVESARGTDDDGKLSQLADPELLGYTFKEWNTAEDGTGEKITADTVFEANTTIYSIFDLNTYTLTNASNEITNDLTFTIKDTSDLSFTLTSSDTDTSKVFLETLTIGGYDYWGKAEVSGEEGEGKYTVTISKDDFASLIAKANTNNEITVAAEWTDAVVEKYAVTITEIEKGGTVTSNLNNAQEEDPVILTVTPDLGYELGTDEEGAILLTVEATAEQDPADEAITVTAESDGTYSFTMPDYAVTVSAEFTAIEYSVDVTDYTADDDDDTKFTDDNENTVELTCTSAVVTDTDYTITFTPEDGYELTSLTIGGVEISVDVISDGEYTMDLASLLKNSDFDTSDNKISISATFALISYDITVDSDIKGGTISVAETYNTETESIEVTVTPENGYELDTLTYKIGDEGTDTKIEADANGEYTITVADITDLDDMVISATFEAIVYTLNFGSDSDGEPNGELDDGNIDFMRYTDEEGHKITISGVSTKVSSTNLSIITTSPSNAYMVDTLFCGGIELEIFQTGSNTNYYKPDLNELLVIDGFTVGDDNEVTISATYKLRPIAVKLAEAEGGNLTLTAVDGDGENTSGLTEVKDENDTLTGYTSDIEQIISLKVTADEGNELTEVNFTYGSNEYQGAYVDSVTNNDGTTEEVLVFVNGVDYDPDTGIMTIDLKEFFAIDDDEEKTVNAIYTLTITATFAEIVEETPAE